MKVLLDSQAFDMQTHGGVSKYFAEIYKHKPADEQFDISVLETDNVYLRSLGFLQAGYTYEHFISRKNFPIKRFLYKLYYNVINGHPSRWDKNPLLNRYLSEQIIKEGKHDVIHATYFEPYILRAIGDKPWLLTVHDMIAELFPIYSPKHTLVTGKRLLIPKASHIIAVSENTKLDLMKLMGIPEDRITVIYHGTDESPFSPSDGEWKNMEYILYVGGRALYKNFRLFCHYLFPVLKRHKNIQVVCTGTPFTKEESAFFEENAMQDRFKHVFVESEQDLLNWYHHAITFVYPSSYEGFGIPILEAYKANCPVMLNHSSCFPEIAGDAAVYFNMSSASSNLEEQLETLYHLDNNERSALLEKQRERLKRYSWKKSAVEHFEVYRKLV